MHACMHASSRTLSSISPSLVSLDLLPTAFLSPTLIPFLSSATNSSPSSPSRAISHIAQGSPYSISLDHTQMANSASGLAVNDECKIKFLDLKARRSFRFIVFRIDEKAMEIKVERLGETSEGYDDFSASLPADECRYAVYDLDFVTDENCQKSKIFFFSWSPDTARTRSKMLYASSKDRFRREMDGIQCEIQATDPSEMSLDIVKGRAGH